MKIARHLVPKKAVPSVPFGHRARTGRGDDLPMRRDTPGGRFPNAAFSASRSAVNYPARTLDVVYGAGQSQKSDPTGSTPTHSGNSRPSRNRETGVKPDAGPGRLRRAGRSARTRRGSPAPIPAAGDLLGDRRLLLVNRRCLVSVAGRALPHRRTENRSAHHDPAPPTPECPASGRGRGGCRRDDGDRCPAVAHGRARRGAGVCRRRPPARDQPLAGAAGDRPPRAP